MTITQPNSELTCVSDMNIKNYLSALCERFPKVRAVKMPSKRFNHTETAIKRASFFWGI